MGGGEGGGWSTLHHIYMVIIEAPAVKQRAVLLTPKTAFRKPGPSRLRVGRATSQSCGWPWTGHPGSGLTWLFQNWVAAEEVKLSYHDRDICIMTWFLHRGSLISVAYQKSRQDRPKERPLMETFERLDPFTDSCRIIKGGEVHTTLYHPSEMPSGALPLPKPYPETSLNMRKFKIRQGSSKLWSMGLLQGFCQLLRVKSCT